MLYIEPQGGLCNRMFAIDSALSLCVKYKQNLTIIWHKNRELNCNYETICKPLRNDKINIFIINTSSFSITKIGKIGFKIPLYRYLIFSNRVQLYMNNFFVKLLLSKEKGSLLKGSIGAYIKNIFSVDKTNKELKSFYSKVDTFNESCVFFKDKQLFYDNL